MIRAKILREFQMKETSNQLASKQIEGEYRNVGLFIDNAKTYIQLATGALLLSVTFSKGINNDIELPLNEISIWISWICWLFSIISGATYQYCAIKYLENIEQINNSLYHNRTKPLFIFRYWVRYPYQLYGIMMLFFYSGTIWFVLTAAYLLAR